MYKRQVKIRGHRVELGEVEAVLAGHPQVGAAAVAVHDHDEQDRRLVAHLVAPGADLGSVRAHLVDRLPAHMIPSRLLRIDRLPLSDNGKLLRDRLPAPESGESTGGTASTERAGSTDGTGTELSAVFADVLGVAHVGPCLLYTSPSPRD